MNRIIATLAEQAKQVSINVQQARQCAAHTTQDGVGVRSSSVALTTGQRNSVSHIKGINANFFHLASLLGSLQNEVQDNAGSSCFHVHGPSDSIMISGQPIEDYVLQMLKELDVISSCIKSESVTIGGVNFESYDNTLKWVTTHGHRDNWKYVMDMPALYCLVKTGGQGHKALLEEQSNSTKAGYASAKQAHLSLLLSMQDPQNILPWEIT